MSPRSVAVAVAAQCRELGAIPYAVLQSAMLTAGYDMADVRSVVAMVLETAGFVHECREIVWVG